MNLQGLYAPAFFIGIALFWLLPIVIILFLSSVLRIYLVNRNSQDAKKISRINEAVFAVRVTVVLVLSYYILPSAVALFNADQGAVPLYPLPLFSDGGATLPLAIMVILTSLLWVYEQFYDQGKKRLVNVLFWVLSSVSVTFGLAAFVYSQNW